MCRRLSADASNGEAELRQAAAIFCSACLTLWTLAKALDVVGDR